MTNKTTAAQITDLFTRVGISIREVVVLGKFVHVDSFVSYNDKIQHILTAAGFDILRANGGAHLDGTDGFRISAKLRA